MNTKSHHPLLRIQSRSVQKGASLSFWESPQMTIQLTQQQHTLEFLLFLEAANPRI